MAASLIISAAISSNTPSTPSVSLGRKEGRKEGTMEGSKEARKEGKKSYKMEEQRGGTTVDAGDKK
jgi:hypothetical protein